MRKYMAAIREIRFSCSGKACLAWLDEFADRVLAYAVFLDLDLNEGVNPLSTYTIA